MASSKPAVPEPSEIAGRYQVETKLGAGAFGTVYKAKDKLLKRMVAIKTIRLEGLAAQGAGLEEMLQRFQREAEVSAQLKHPNIVTIYDVGNSDGLSYLAMEFIDGVGLEKLIAQGRLPVERAASLAAQVADALDFAHQRGVVHRDIKPANIMVEAGDRVKVTDFGIAKVTESADHLTMTGSILGTPSYMSPEQARGGDALDGRSDLFSLGCVLYEMLGKEKAFRGAGITALIFKIITEDPPPLREVAPDVPEAIARIVQKALAKAPDARYQTGRLLADDLMAFVRAGNVPTIRQVETPTVPGPAMAATPTVAIPGTLSVPPTQANIATRVAEATPRPARPAPPVATKPPLPRTPPVPRPAAPLPVARKSGGGAGMLVGVGLVGFGLAAVAAVAGFYLFLRRPPETTTANTTVTVITAPATAPAATTPETAPVTAPPASIVSPPVTAANPPLTSPPATAPPPTQATSPAGSTLRPKPPRPPEGRPPLGMEGGSPGEGGPAGEQSEPVNAFLDQAPPAVDGREAGARVAEAYRSGGGRSSGFGSSRANQPRPLSPTPRSPAEGFAINAVRNIINAQQSFHQKNGRYGTLEELVRAGTLPLANVGPNGNGFTHRAYRFEMEAGGERFRVLATPRLPRAGPRTFIGDESSYIRDAAEE
jgi:serine/threonine-protein kinase